jgi:hypothetical protein
MLTRVDANALKNPYVPARRHMLAQSDRLAQFARQSFASRLLFLKLRAG